MAFSPGPWVQPDDQVVVFNADGYGGTWRYPSTNDAIRESLGDVFGNYVTYRGGVALVRAHDGPYPGEEDDAVVCAWRLATMIYSRSDPYWSADNGPEWGGVPVCPVPASGTTYDCGITSSTYPVGYGYSSERANVYQTIRFAINGQCQFFNYTKALTLLGPDGLAGYEDYTPDPGLGGFIEWEDTLPELLMVEVRPDEMMEANEAAPSSLDVTWTFSASIPNRANPVDLPVYGEYGDIQWGPRWPGFELSEGHFTTWVGNSGGFHHFPEQAVVDAEGTIAREHTITTAWHGDEAETFWAEVQDPERLKGLATENLDPAYNIKGGLRLVAMPSQADAETSPPSELSSMYGHLGVSGDVARAYQFCAVRLTVRPARYRVVTLIPDAVADPQRVHPRDDTLGINPTGRVIPPPQSVQRSNRTLGHTYR